LESNASGRFPRRIGRSRRSSHVHADRALGHDRRASRKQPVSPSCSRPSWRRSPSPRICAPSTDGRHDAGTTTEVAAVITFGLGWLRHGEPQLAAMIGVIVVCGLVAEAQDPRVRARGIERQGSESGVDLPRHCSRGPAASPEQNDRSLGDREPSKLWLLFVLIRRRRLRGVHRGPRLGPDARTRRGRTVRRVRVLDGRDVLVVAAREVAGGTSQGRTRQESSWRTLLRPARSCSSWPSRILHCSARWSTSSARPS